MCLELDPQGLSTFIQNILCRKLQFHGRGCPGGPLSNRPQGGGQSREGQTDVLTEFPTGPGLSVSPKEGCPHAVARTPACRAHRRSHGTDQQVVSPGSSAQSNRSETQTHLSDLESTVFPLNKADVHLATNRSEFVLKYTRGRTGFAMHFSFNKTHTSSAFATDPC